MPTRKPRQAKAVGSTKGNPATTDEASAGALTNQRHEAFAQAVARGASGAGAYREAYGDVKSARTQASSLLAYPDISERIKDLQAQSARGTVMTLQEKLEYLTLAILTPLDQIDESSPLCQSAKYSEAGRELKMVDKLRALELLTKLQGHFAAEKIEHKGDMTVNVVVPKDRLSEIQKRRREAMEASRN